MVRHTITVFAVPSQADTQLSPISVSWSTNALIPWSAGIRSQDSPPSHGPIVLRSPVNGSEAPMADGLLRATGCDAQRRNPKSSAGYNNVEPHLFFQIWPFRIQIWTEGVLVEHPAPVVGRCNVCPVSFKNRMDITRIVSIF